MQLHRFKTGPPGLSFSEIKWQFFFCNATAFTGLEIGIINKRHYNVVTYGSIVMTSSTGALTNNFDRSLAWPRHVQWQVLRLKPTQTGLFVFKPAGACRFPGIEFAADSQFIFLCSCTWLLKITRPSALDSLPVFFWEFLHERLLPAFVFEGLAEGLEQLFEYDSVWTSSQLLVQ